MANYKDSPCRRRRPANTIKTNKAGPRNEIRKKILQLISVKYQS
jgi:hypothetical protein